MLFYMLQKFPNIKKAVINDINPDLTTCYKVVRDTPEQLLQALEYIQDEYYSFDNEDAKRAYFLAQRERYNTKTLSPIENSAFFIFLNRTCFNGLYRVNKSGLFNVPFGKYASPTICDHNTIMADSKILQCVEIMTGDFEETFHHASRNTLYYFDPPYRPLSSTSNFKDYTKEGFNDDSQIRLKLFCDKLNMAGHYFMLSNSDCFGNHEHDLFFEELFLEYDIHRVSAMRNINSIASKRGRLTEILVRNFKGET